MVLSHGGYGLDLQVGIHHGEEVTQYKGVFKWNNRNTQLSGNNMSKAVRKAGGTLLLINTR